MKRFLIALFLLTTVITLSSLPAQKAFAVPPGCYLGEGNGTNTYTPTSCPSGPAQAVNEYRACFVVFSGQRVDERDCNDLAAPANLSPDVSSGPSFPEFVPQACALSDSFLGIPTWYKYLDKETDSSGKCSVVLNSNASGEDSLESANSSLNAALPIGVAVLEAILRISGLVAVVMVFWGGFKYITARGNPDNAKGARTTVINAMIGLVIVILATAIVSFIGRSV